MTGTTSSDQPQNNPQRTPIVPVAPPSSIAPVAPLNEVEVVWNYPSRSTLARWLLVAVALYGVGWVLWNAQSGLTPFIIGLVLAYLLNPLVNWFNRQRLPRWLAILIVYLGGLALTLLALAFVVPPVSNQLQELIASIPDVDTIQAQGNELLRDWRQTVPDSVRVPVENGVRSALESLQANATGYAQRLGGFALDQVLSVVNTLNVLIGFLIIPFWLFYVLNDERKGKEALNKMLHPRLQPDFWNIWQLVDHTFSGYIRGQLILCVAVGSAVGVGLFALRLFGFEVRYILLLSIIAAITELVPVIGPIIGAIPAILLAIFSGGENTGAMVLAVAVVYLLVQQLENSFLVPRIVGESVGIHEAVLTVILIAFGQIFGLLGVILAAPIAAIARDLFLYVYRRLGGQSPAQSVQKVIVEKEQTDMNAVNDPKVKRTAKA